MKNLKLLLYILSFIMGFAWVWFFTLDWKIALAVLLVMFSNNLVNEAKNL